MDVDSIPLGVNFADRLAEEVGKCDILLAIIGKNWLDSKDGSGKRRLDNPNDFVRLEIRAALSRSIPVVPVFLDGAKPPPSEFLPDDLKSLSLRNGLDINHASFHSDVHRLISGIEKYARRTDQESASSPVLPAAPQQPIKYATKVTPGALSPLKRTRRAYVGAVTVAAIGVLAMTVVIWQYNFRPAPLHLPSDYDWRSVGSQTARAEGRIPVLFGTTRRNLSGGRGGDLKFGRVMVQIPIQHRLGRVELPTQFSLLGFPIYTEKLDLEKHFSTNNPEELNASDFSKLLSDILSASKENTVTIYVHGQNHSLQSAVQRAAQVTADAKIKGLVLVFSWPSAASIASYLQDVASAQASIPEFADFISKVHQTVGGRKLNVIAHGSGADLAMQGAALAIKTANVKIAELIFAAPDSDAEIFLKQCLKVKDEVRGITIYSSEVDAALKVSTQVHGAGRAGSVVSGNPLVLGCGDVIDVSRASTGILDLGHDAAFVNLGLLQDVSAILNSSLRPPSERNLALRDAVGRTGIKYWKLVQ